MKAAKFLLLLAMVPFLSLNFHRASRGNLSNSDNYTKVCISDNYAAGAKV